MNERMSYRCEVQASSDGERLRVEIYDYIDSAGGGWGISAAELINAITLAGDVKDIDLHIHSGGGEVFEALAIYNRLKSHPARVHSIIDGLAASAASVIAMAGDDISMPENAWMMVHQPLVLAFGNADEMRSQADFLDRNTDMLVGIYSARSGRNEAEVRKWVTDETWFDGRQAKEAGLIDRVTEANRVAASANVSAFKNAPLSAVQRFSVAEQDKDTRKEPNMDSNPTISQIKAVCPGADAEFLVEQNEKGASLQDAMSAWVNTLNARLQNRDDQLANLTAQHEEKVAAIKAEHEAAIEAKQGKVADLEQKLKNVKAGLGDGESPGASAGGESGGKVTFGEYLRRGRNN